jgi:energy-coupling factor transporter ATP-binding protein EcfA2
MSEEEKYLPTTVEKVFEALDKRVISLGVPGLFGSLGIAKAGENKWQEAGLCLAAAVGVLVVIQVGKKLAPKLDQLLDLGLGFVESSGQRVWAIATDRFQGKYYQRLIYDCREYEGRGFNAGALKLDQVYVPLRLTQCSADGAGQNLIRRYDVGSAQQNIGQMLEELSGKDSACCRLVVLGAPGSGKSTLLRHITLMYALHRQRELGRQVPKLIPVLLRLRDVYQLILDNPGWVLVDLIERSVKELQKTEPLVVRAGWFGKKLRQGRCLVMLDGLDEIPEDGDRTKVSAWVDDQLKAYPESKFILTSRPDAYRRSALRENAIESEVQPLARPDRDEFIRNWCGNWRKSQSKKKPDLGDRDKIERAALNLIAQIAAVPALCLMSTNPLLLVLMAKTYSEKGALSKRRVDIYRDVCQVLLEGRSRITDVPSGASRLSYDRKQAILQVLALEMTRKEQLQFTLTRVSTHLNVFDGAVELLDRELARVPNNRMTAEDFIRKDEVGVRELVSEQQQEGVYEFAHKTFQEYLTAAEIKRLGEPEILCEVFTQDDRPQDYKALSWWREVILFYVAQADATPIIKAAMPFNRKTISSNRLMLAYECLESTENVDGDTRRYIEGYLERGLCSSDFKTFQFIVEILLNLRLQQLNSDIHRTENFSSVVRDELPDTSPIMQAEYKLFVSEMQPDACDYSMTDPKAACLSHQHDFQLANFFCRWLMEKTERKFLQSGICYRPMWKNNCLYIIRFHVPQKYYHLAKLLAAGEWEQADYETYKLMITNPTVGKKEGDYFERKNLENFPCADLLTIDRLWIEASNGHFGFSVQKKIWQKCGSPMDYNDNYGKFMEEVGWRSGGSFVDYNDLKFSTSNSMKGELPALLVLFGVGLVRYMNKFSFLAQRLVNCSTRQF